MTTRATRTSRRGRSGPPLANIALGALACAVTAAGLTAVLPQFSGSRLGAVAELQDTPSIPGPKSPASGSPSGASHQPAPTTSPSMTGPTPPSVLSGAALWLDFSNGAGVTISGADIVQVKDRSANHNDAGSWTGLSAPVISTINGRRAGGFGALSGLVTPTYGIPHGTTPATVYTVAALDDPDPFSTCFAHIVAWWAADPTKARILEKGCWQPTIYADTFSSSGKMSPPMAWRTGAPMIVRATFTTTGTALAVNGGPAYRWTSDTALRATWTADPLYVGAARWDVNGGWRGRIGELIILDQVPTAAQDDSVVRYLRAKWGF